MVRDGKGPEVSGRYVRAAQLADVQSAGCIVVQVKEHAGVPIPVKLSSESGEGVQGRSEATLG
jgi:hypothetical protein